jgi:hypothetical protein
LSNPHLFSGPTHLRWLTAFLWPLTAPLNALLFVDEDGGSGWRTQDEDGGWKMRMRMKIEDEIGG